jgi:cytochrome b561
MTALRNTTESWGLVSRALHWGMALLIIVLLALGNRISSMQPTLDTLWLYGLHKTLGITLFALVGFRILWHFLSRPPGLADLTAGQRWIARAGHLGLYALMVALPLTGWAGSSATGIDTVVFGQMTLPPLVGASVEGEAFWFRLHGTLAYALFGLVTLHVLAALMHEMQGTGLLTRMLRGRAR